MHRPTDRRTAGQHRYAAVGAVLSGLLVLTGCVAGTSGDPGTSDASAPTSSATPSDRPSPSEPEATPGAITPAPAAPGPAGTAVAADVPVRSAGLDDVVVTPEPVPPVGLTVPALGIQVPVDPVGVQPDGQMEIPPLAERAGWYRFGSSPAEPDGTAVIAAHVDSVASAGLGPFARLGDAGAGDVVDVSLADGSTRQYVVTTVERRAKPEIAWSDVFVRDGVPRLVLVTCGGTFQRDVGRYSDNVIVTAQPTGG